MRKLGKMLFEAVSSLFKKPATSEYPEKKRPIHKSIAGMISFEQMKCIGCNMCVRNCPADAIKIIKTADKVFSCELSLANCIFCSQCVVSCPKKALHTTDNFELAQIDKSKLTVKLEDLNPEAKMTPEILAKMEAAAVKAKEAALAAAKAKEQSSKQAQAADVVPATDSRPAKTEAVTAVSTPVQQSVKQAERTDNTKPVQETVAKQDVVADDSSSHDAFPKQSSAGEPSVKTVTEKQSNAEQTDTKKQGNSKDNSENKSAAVHETKTTSEKKKSRQKKTKKA